MNILLTGEPRSGKTTLLESVIKDIYDKQGFVAKEVRENSERIGFVLVSSLGQTASLASVTSESEIRVSHYGVNVDELDIFLSNLPSAEQGNLIYVDEIGQMELFSEKFKTLITGYLNLDNTFIGTVTSIFHNDFTKQVLERDDIMLLEITEANRDQMSSALLELAMNVKLLQRLSPEAKTELTKMARGYAKSGSFVQLNKLFKKTLKYIAEGRVENTSGDNFLVRGDTDEHNVTNFEGWSCDCDLFNGIGNYDGHPGECSHIQSAKLTVVM